jgi:transposase-like protein
MLAGQRTNNLPLTMPILLDCPFTIKKYMIFVKTYHEDTFCPCCGRITRRHGKYEKTVHFKYQSFRIPIMRRRCPDCNKTFSLMPCFSHSWARFANHIYEFFVRWLMAGIPISQLTEFLTTSSVSVISLKTLYRWKKRFFDSLGKWWIRRRQEWAAEFQEADGVLSLYREGMSSNQEIHFLLSFYFGEIESVPGKGRLFSMINLRQPFSCL